MSKRKTTAAAVLAAMTMGAPDAHGYTASVERAREGVAQSAAELCHVEIRILEVRGGRGNNAAWYDCMAHLFSEFVIREAKEKKGVGYKIRPWQD